MFFFHIIELRISNNFSISISISIFTCLHFYKCYARIFYCNSRAGMIQFIRLTECSTRGSALVLRSEFVMTKTRLRGSPQVRVERIPLGSTETCSPVFLQVDCQHLLESHFRYMLGGMYFFIYANKNNGKTFFQTCYGLKFGSFPVITDFQQK